MRNKEKIIVSSEVKTILYDLFNQIQYELIEQYEEFKKENEKLNGAIQTYDILLKSNIEENKQLKSILVELEETIKNKIKGFKEDKDYFIDEKDMYELDNLIQKLKEE